MKQFDELVRVARRAARRAGMKRQDIAAAVRKARRGT